MTAIAHDVVEHTATIEEFAEQTALATRMMYAAPNRRTTHRLLALDVPVPSIMRAPGETPGMFALESAIDELAIACGLDPVELRIRNEPETDPHTGLPWSSRGLVGCLREGARRFGWEEAREPRRDGRWLIGTGVASSTYPARRRAATATARAEADGTYTVRIDAVDIGTGAWTVLTQIAADELDVPVERVALAIGDSSLPKAGGAGGSMGTASWGSAIVEAARALKARIDEEGLPAEATGEVDTNPHAASYSMHSFGAQFAEVRVDSDTGEVRVPRLLGVFAVGRIINPHTGRSQLIGGMTMGLSMALHEESVIDPRFGHYANHDFAEYHIAANADVQELDAVWIEEEDFFVNAMGAKGVGEIGITGTAAAIANAVHHATGVRVRDLPIRPDRLLSVSRGCARPRRVDGGPRPRGAARRRARTPPRPGAPRRRPPASGRSASSGGRRGSAAARSARGARAGRAPPSASRAAGPSRPRARARSAAGSRPGRRGGWSRRTTARAGRARRRARPAGDA